MKRLLIPLILFIVNITGVEAQWEETNGPYGGLVHNIIITPNEAGGKNLFACLFYIVLSTDDGISWKTASTGITTNVVSLAASSDGKVLAAGGKGVIYLSTNNGTSWSGYSSGLPSLNADCLVACSDGKGGVNIYAGMWSNYSGGEIGETTGSGVYLSTDMGASWKYIGLTEYFGVSSLLTIPNETGGTDLYAGKTNNYSNNVYLYHTTNNGASWDSLHGINEIMTMATGSDGQGGTNIYAGTEKGSVWTSSDKGKTWRSVNISSGYIYSLSVYGSDVYAGTSNSGVYHSTDMGVSWEQINTGLFNPIVLSVAADDKNIYAGTEDSGVFVSTDSGESWTSRNQGLQKICVSALAVIGNNLYAGTSGNGVHISTNNGETWTETNNGLANLVVEALTLNPNNAGGEDIWAATESGISISTDDGVSWITLNNELKSALVLSLAVKGKTLLAGTAEEGAWLSTNYGTSWTQISKGLESTEYPYESIYSIAFSGNNFIAGTKGHGMFLSTNSGTNWSQIKLPIQWPYTNIEVNTLSTIPNGNGGTKLLAATNSGVLISTDDGVSWSFSNSGLPSILYDSNFSPVGILTNGKGEIDFLVVTADTYLYLSADSCKNWSAVKTKLPSTTHGVFSFAVKNNYLYAGTDAMGVIRLPITDILTDVKKTETLPAAFNLAQNYPNPFNPTTKISFSIPSKDLVRLKVYDILGREIDVLADKVYEAGKYEIEFNAANLPSGVYFYNLTTGSNSVTKKMILMK